VIESFESPASTTMLVMPLVENDVLPVTVVPFASVIARPGSLTT
jgi:hypothetical protein